MENDLQNNLNINNSVFICPWWARQCRCLSTCLPVYLSIVVCCYKYQQIRLQNLYLLQRQMHKHKQLFSSLLPALMYHFPITTLLSYSDLPSKIQNAHSALYNVQIVCRENSGKSEIPHSIWPQPKKVGVFVFQNISLINVIAHSGTVFFNFDNFQICGPLPPEFPSQHCSVFKKYHNCLRSRFMLGEISFMENQLK